MSARIRVWRLVLILATARAYALEPGVVAPPLPASGGWVFGEAPAAGAPARVFILWSAHDAACREAMPRLGQWRERYAPRGVVFAGLTRDAEAEVRAFAEKTPLPFPVAIDAGANTNAAWWRGADPLPHAVLLDARGAVVWSGYALDGLQDRIDALLAPPAPPQPPPAKPTPPAAPEPRAPEAPESKTPAAPPAAETPAPAPEPTPQPDPTPDPNADPKPEPPVKPEPPPEPPPPEPPTPEPVPEPEPAGVCEERLLKLLADDNYDEAMNLIARALERDPRQPGLQHLKAGLLIQSGNAEAFRDQCARMRELFADSAEDLNQLAWTLVQPSPLPPGFIDPTVAIEAAREAARLTNHEDPAVLDTLAHAYIRAGMHEEALDTATRALRLLTPADTEDAADLRGLIAFLHRAQAARRTFGVQARPSGAPTAPAAEASSLADIVRTPEPAQPDPRAAQEK
jgi:hypothetical protein